jgi:hypothetical protein
MISNRLKPSVGEISMGSVDLAGNIGSAKPNVPKECLCQPINPTVVICHLFHNRLIDVPIT